MVAILTRNMYNLKLQIKDMPKIWHQYTKYILHNNLHNQKQISNAISFNQLQAVNLVFTCNIYDF